MRAPALSPVPSLGSRWISAGLTLLLGFMLYTMWTATTFTVSAAEVTGNQRLDRGGNHAAGLGMTGQPIFKAVPAQIEKNLRTAFPDLAVGQAYTIGFPNRISVAVDRAEPRPGLVPGRQNHLDRCQRHGFYTTRRCPGPDPGRLQAASPAGPTVDPTKPIYDQPFIEPAMVQAILALSPKFPTECR